MKKLMIFLTLVSSALFAFGQTTLDEWNYVTKGFRIQNQTGLEKPGYIVIFDHQQKDGNVFCDFSYLIKQTNNGDEKVAIMVHTNYMGDNYYCIPKIGNNEVDLLYKQQVYQLARIKNPVAMLIIWQLSIYVNWN